MFLTHCVMGWIVLTVLSLSLPVWSAVKVIQPYSVTTVNGTAKVQCFIQPQPLFHQIQPSKDCSSRYPYPDPRKVRVSLLRGLHGSQELCSSTLSIPELITDTDGKNGQQCSAELTEGAVELTVSGLEATDTDIYRCGIEVLYPPPYLKLIGNGTLVHVLERSECPVQEHRMVTALHGAAEKVEEDEGEADRRTESASTPVVVLVTLVIIILIIIIYLQTRQYRQVRRRELIRSVPGGPYKVDAVAISCDNSI